MTHLNPAPRRDHKWPETAAGLAGLALTCYWAWTFDGVYKWLAELQLRVMHEYEIQLTFVFTLLITAGVLVGLVSVIRSALPGRRAAVVGPATATPPAAAADEVDERGYDAARPAAGPAAVELRRPARAASPLKSGLFTGAVFLLLGAALAGAGAYQWRRGAAAGAKVSAHVRDYESGAAPAGTWVAVRGHSLLDEARGFQDGQAGMKYYIPLVSDDFQPGRGVAIFLETTSPNMMPSNWQEQQFRSTDPRGGVRAAPPPEDRWEGMLADGGLPGLVRERFKDSVLAPADHYRVLSVGESPETAMRTGRQMMYGGAGVAAFSVVMGAFVMLLGTLQQRRQARRVAAPADPRLRVKSIVGARPVVYDEGPDNWK